MGLLEADIIVEPKTFNESESFTIPVTGYYYVEAWGADGGHGGNATTTQGRGGAGSYQSGLYYFNKGQTIQVQVGERGGNGARAEVGADISRGAGGKALVAGGATAAWFGAGGSGGAGGDNRSGNSAFRGGGGGGGGAASGILSGGEVHLAASGGGGGGGRTGYTVGSMSGGNSNGGGNGTNPGNGTIYMNEKTPTGGAIATPAQQNGGGVAGETTHMPTWPGGGGGGGGGGYNPNGGGGGYGGHGSDGYGSAAGGAGGSNWVGGTYYKPAGSPDIPSGIRTAVINMTRLPRTSNGNGVVKITPVGL
jgi:hypothetical protein